MTLVLAASQLNTDGCPGGHIEQVACGLSVFERYPVTNRDRNDAPLNKVPKQVQIGVGGVAQRKLDFCRKFKVHEGILQHLDLIFSDLGEVNAGLTFVGVARFFRLRHIGS